MMELPLIFVQVNVEKMFTLLKVPNEKIKHKLISDVKQRVTSLFHVLGEPVSFQSVAHALRYGFEEEFQIDLVKGQLTSEEQILADQFTEECFSQESWNHKR